MDPSLDREPVRVGDDLADAQIEKLARVSLVYSDTFAAHPSIDAKGYANLARLWKTYGRVKVADVFDYCIERRIVPQGTSAMGLVIALLKTRGDHG